jgi:hypothetical protein
MGSNPVVCSASDQCHDAGTCNPANGTCSNPPKPNGAACDDGNTCTLADECTAGACSGVSDSCGDGEVQGECNEVCDHGATNGADACCSEACQPIDTDEDGTCDGLDACTHPAPIRRSRLLVSAIDTPPGDDRLLFKGEVGVPYPYDPPLDPAANGVRILLADAAATVLDVAVAPGSAWSTNGSRSKWQYSNPAGSAGGITRVSLRKSARAGGLLKFAIKGRDGSYAVSSGALPLTAHVIFDPPSAATGQCGIAEFTGSPPAPSCVVDSTGRRVTCR